MFSYLFILNHIFFLNTESAVFPDGDSQQTDGAEKVIGIMKAKEVEFYVYKMEQVRLNLLQHIILSSS